MNIIFLDVDGVLNIMSDSYNSCAWINLSYDAVEPHLMKRLEYLIEQTDAYIVISSSWSEVQLKQVLEQKRFKYIDRILGRTHRGQTDNPLNVPDERLIIQQGTGIKFLEYRGDQINEWIHDNNFSGNYVVLEDEILDVCGELCNSIPKENVIEVDMNEGLSHKNVLEAISILKGSL